jgi:ankyrin repeat protein
MLQRAVLQSDIEAVRKLLNDEKIDINAADNETMSALHWAAGSRFDTPILRQTTTFFSHFILFIIAYNDISIIKEILKDSRVDVNVRNKRNHTPLHTAAAHNAAAAIEILLSNENNLDIDVDAINQWNETALHLAAAAGHFSCVFVLLK